MSNNNDVIDGFVAGFFVLIILVVLVFTTAVITKDVVENRHEKQDTIKHRIEILENRVYELERRN
jgi:membrane protein implicated in regulation of membrane protease activity